MKLYIALSFYHSIYPQSHELHIPIMNRGKWDPHSDPIVISCSEDYNIASRRVYIS